MNCREILERAQYLLDGEITFLDDDERQRIEQHLHDCEPCLKSHGLQEQYKAVMRKLSGSAACPDDLRVRVTAIFEEYRSGPAATS
jgi:mycothiol system anti-sigma-R factor